MTKQELRKIYLGKRVDLSPVWCSQTSLLLSNYFFLAIDLSFVRVLHTYLPIQKNNEPDTWLIVERIRREFPHVKISLPRVTDGDRIESIYFEGLHQLYTNTWGIQEPGQGVSTLEEKIDIVIVPLLVLDQRGHRVGYGRGFYDRFLKLCRNDCLKIGLSFFEPVNNIIDVESFDVPLDAWITPDGVHRKAPE